MAVNTVQLSGIITWPSHPGAGGAGHRGRLAPLDYECGDRASQLQELPPSTCTLAASVTAAVRNPRKGASRVEEPNWTRGSFP